VSPYPTNDRVGTVSPDRTYVARWLLVFTLEHAVGDSNDAGFHLELHGRYSHMRPYVEHLLTGSGLQSKIIQTELRMEAGAPVQGLVIAATKPV
jgi:predicted TPR repeat methyltransferase